MSVTIDESDWLVEPLRRHVKYARRPHFFEQGAEKSVCDIAWRKPDMLHFNPATARTVEDDPRLGEPQFRRECGTCANLVREQWLQVHEEER